MLELVEDGGELFAQWGGARNTENWSPGSTVVEATKRAARVEK